MNWQHLTAFVWLRTRLLANQWRRGGTLNAVLMTIVAVSAAVTAVPLCVGSFALGVFLIPRARPFHLLVAWDALILVFLFFWTIGLITELQRSEPLSLSKFLHLPVSVNAAFLINYVSSLLRLSLIVFVPPMLGYAAALVAVKGTALLPVLPLLAAFLLMVTALTYQFQGWLASLMTNPRRRRTVVVTVTTLFVLVAQLPNLINLYSPWGMQRHTQASSRFAQETTKLQHESQAELLASQERVRGVQQRLADHQRAGQTELVAQDVATLRREAEALQRAVAESSRRQKELTERQRRTTQEADRRLAVRAERAARLANTVLPVGWLALGSMYAAEGRLAPAALGLLGMALIGTVSLGRAYRTTLRQYQGQATARAVAPPAEKVVSAPGPGPKPKSLPLGTRLPGLSEPAAAVALGGLRSLLRAPEAKMMLLTPLIMVFVFGSMIFQQRAAIPEPARPLLAIGAMVFVMFGVLQLMANQFGFDRDGFRVLVLSPAPRQDVLLGKNLAFAPITFGMAGGLLLILQVLCPMRADHFVAMVPQFVSMFLVFCLLVNLISIYAPLPVAAGSLKPVSPKLSTVCLQLLMFLVLFPVSQAVTTLPLGVEALLNAFGWGARVPVGLLLCLAECAAVAVVYRIALRGQGKLLQAREHAILEVVTHRGT